MHFNRYSSRALLIPFCLPSVGPQNEEESMQFQKLMEIRDNCSSAVGWAVSLGKVFRESGRDEIASRMRPLMQQLLPFVDPRLITGYAVLLYFCEKVCIKVN